MNSIEIRSKLTEALELDLIGPSNSSLLSKEALSQPPSRWYLTGFLAPLGAKAEQRSDQTSFDEIDQGGDPGGPDDDSTPERKAAKRSYFPSSLGISCIIGPTTRSITASAVWGDYKLKRGDSYLEKEAVHLLQAAEQTGETSKEEDESTGKLIWERLPQTRSVAFKLDSPLQDIKLPDESGLKITVSVREIVSSNGKEGELPKGCRSVSVFLVNYREPYDHERFKDLAFAFQAGLKLECSEGFIPRPNTRGLQTDDPDELIADLQYRDSKEFSVGHGVATKALLIEGRCTTVESTWVPKSEVERVEPREVRDVALEMEALATVPSPEELIARLTPLALQYADWIRGQKNLAPKSPKRRAETATELIKNAETACRRIEDGIQRLMDQKVFEAFRIANSAMAIAAKQKRPNDAPKWRPFQLAFILLNLAPIDDPKHVDRNTSVDLLFFPTGGGKTEAYLGLTAFTLVLRRLRNPTKFSAGVTVLMRYTLRLLTLDQLGRAATLICALELERKRNPEKFGPWPFEIGLWVGQAATPNKMGSKSEKNPFSARSKTIAYWNNPEGKPAPIPIEECPWCSAKFQKDSFRLHPNSDNPTDLIVRCMNRGCAFSGDQQLPIVAVDDQIYRRLPCFIIATVDKFAAMPWTAQVGALFGRVDRHSEHGFFGAGSKASGNTSAIPGGRLLPPELVIQDELHLISGPMGTMVGLYEGAVDELCSQTIDGKRVVPKIIASTATVKRAERQIQALFNRRKIHIFPPPGQDIRDSFFAVTKSPKEANARLYVGVAAQGRSLKVTLLRTYLALLSAAQKLYDAEGGTAKKGGNPVDPYMTVLGYFNSLRELGGSRRIVEDEIKNRLTRYSKRHRVGETEGFFADRDIRHELVELTSRVHTNDVAEAKRRLSLEFHEKERVDVALATNMISVGLDITRLGLMVVLGQPKTTAEYIQTSSRVGRLPQRPGLVVTLFNIHKHRDRSHYERFDYYHETFYRNVEVTSVTPFSPRALDKGLAGAVVALARQGLATMTPAKGAANIQTERQKLQFVVESLSQRAADYITRPPEESERIRAKLKDRIIDLLDKWTALKLELDRSNTQLQYNAHEEGGAKPLLHDFLDPELQELPANFKFFRANRSMRDVEPSVNIWLKTLDNQEIAEDT